MQDPNTPFGQPPTTPAQLPPSGFTPGPSTGNDEDVLGWVGVGLGAVSWLACCCSIIPFVGLVANVLALLMAVAAIILGFLSLRNAQRAGRPATLGIVGMVLGGARLGLLALAIVAVIIVFALGLGGGILSAMQQQGLGG